MFGFGNSGGGGWGGDLQNRLAGVLAARGGGGFQPGGIMGGPGQGGLGGLAGRFGAVGGNTGIVPPHLRGGAISGAGPLTLPAGARSLAGGPDRLAAHGGGGFVPGWAQQFAQARSAVAPQGGYGMNNVEAGKAVNAMAARNTQGMNNPAAGARVNQLAAQNNFANEHQKAQNAANSQRNAQQSQANQFMQQYNAQQASNAQHNQRLQHMQNATNANINAGHQANQNAFNANQQRALDMRQQAQNAPTYQSNVQAKKKLY
jgi:hypothetical protein